MEIIVTQSLVKRMFNHGVIIEYCPKSVYEHTISKTADFSSESMDKGTFFETLCLGGGFEGKVLNDLPRKKDGGKTLDQIRIEEQHLRFETLVNKYGMHIIPGVNTQTKLVKRFPEKIDGIDIFISGDLDIFPTVINTNKRQNLLSTIDTKLTKDIHTGFGMFNWNDAASMDHIQAHMYHELMMDIDPALNPIIVETIKNLGFTMEQYEEFEKHFFYWVFDYSPSKNVKMIEILYDSLKQKELYESVRATAAEVVFNTNSERWNDTKPSKDNCGFCALNCPFRLSKEESSSCEIGGEFDNCEFEIL